MKTNEPTPLVKRPAPQKEGNSPVPSASPPQQHPADASVQGCVEGIRATTHRVMGSRESMRRVERSHQRRQPKRGHGSQRRPSAPESES